jgi:surfeit locus 1 family protein
MNKLRLSLEWRTTVVSAVLLPMLLSLSWWQLQRADEKAAISAQWQQRQQEPARPLLEIDSTQAQDLAYLPVALRGEFVQDHYFLLDNRIHKGKFGYEVLAIMLLADSQRAVLVNRGWIAGDPSRQSLPDIDNIGGQQTVLGHIYVPPGAPYLLGESSPEPGWPKRVQAVEMDKLQMAFSTVSPATLFPYTVRIEPNSNNALTVGWQVVNTSPEKHTAYAVQWFAMAAALLILFVLRSSNIWQLVTRSTGKEH